MTNLVNGIGRNLIQGSEMNSLKHWTSNGRSIVTIEGGHIKNTMSEVVSTPGLRYLPRLDFPVGTYTMQLNANLDGLNEKAPFILYLLDGSGNFGERGGQHIARKKGWWTYDIKLEVTEPLQNKTLYFLTSGAFNVGDYILYGGIKLEKGTVATPYQQAPEDMMFPLTWGHIQE